MNRLDWTPVRARAKKREAFREVRRARTHAVLRRTIVAICVTAVVVLALATSALARSPDVYTGILSSTAVGGYDPVAYFIEGRPVPGKPEIAFTWKGVTWRFATEKNRDLFKDKPEAYAPQFGGYCAWAVSRGYTAKGDPRYWKVVDGKLYLNYDAGVQKDWEKDVPGNIAKGNKNWPAVLDK